MHARRTTNVIVLVYMVGFLGFGSVSGIPMHGGDEEMDMRRQIESRQQETTQHSGETASSRIVAVALCLVYMFLIAIVAGHRLSLSTSTKTKTKWKPTDTLILTLLLLATTHTLTAALLISGLGLSTQPQCHAAIRICIIFYGVGKILIYTLLTERFHIVRAPFTTRSRDPLYLAGTALITLSFGAIIIYELVSPRASIDAEGRCWMGVQRAAGYAVIVVDTVINVLVTGVFVGLLWPVVVERARRHSSAALEGGSEGGSRRSEDIGRKSGGRRVLFRETVKSMLWRNVIGSVLALVGTVANNVVFLTVEGAMRGWICLMICLSDIVWSVLIVSWLTMPMSRNNSPRRNDDWSRTSMLSTSVGITPVRTRERSEGEKAIAFSLGCKDG
ncbi:hypothetical protein EJ04DRAFT_500684 [Polyplosphaeria fusca]|uniref:Uncharacterized protein n=1 Tax=Polyplosphaeria fusca TaxID=682080 RepID=A0A9P4QSY3_9PLEO|nr:hypothetical protein EJ04DRAFT_500684 [Polyplosphaeria fusca]